MYGNYGNRGYGGGRDNRGGDFGRTPPVNEGDQLDVRIEAVGEKGDGVAKKDGFVLFVPNVKEGDEVRIKVTKVLRKVGFAEVVGQAQGPIAAASAPAQKPRSAAEEKAAEIREVEQNASQMEDSEDFGEEEPEAPAEDEEAFADEPEEEPEAPADGDPEEEPAVDEPAPVAPEEPADGDPEEEPSVAPPDPADDDLDSDEDDEEDKQQF